LRCFPRSEKQFFTETQYDNNNDDGGSNAMQQQQQQQQQQVGAHNGNLQVGWINDGGESSPLPMRGLASPDWLGRA
jgi:hypothetical protein